MYDYYLMHSFNSYKKYPNEEKGQIWSHVYLFQVEFHIKYKISEFEVEYIFWKHNLLIWLKGSIPLLSMANKSIKNDNIYDYKRRSKVYHGYSRMNGICSE
jgi:hypothetical protein